MAGAERFKNPQIPRLGTERARLKVIQGPDIGAVYVLTSSRVRIGRGEECDVALADLKASRVHAELLQVPGGWELHDLGSANGVLINGKLLQKGAVKTRDVVGVGDTLFEFFMSNVESTQILSSPGRSSQMVLQDQKMQQNQLNRVAALRGLKPGSISDVAKAMGSARPSATEQKSLLKNPVVMTALLVMGALLLFVDEQKTSVKAKKKENGALAMNTRELAALLPPDPSDPKNADGTPSSTKITGLMSSSRSISMFLKAGFREYSQGNYLRAKVQFENVLQISPSNPIAKIYYENSSKKIDADVKKYMDLGRKDLEAGKLRTARGQFEAALRLLYRDTTNQNYIDAKENVNKINTALLEGDTTKLREPARSKVDSSESDGESKSSQKGGRSP